MTEKSPENSTLWLQHLSASLRASRQLAYLYHVEDDRYEFMGDIMGVLGLPEDEAPRTKEDIKNQICQDDVVSRQIGIADSIRESRNGEKSFTLRYRLCRSDGTAIPVIETGIVRFDDGTKKTTIQSLMAIDVLAIEQKKRLARKMEFRDMADKVLSGNTGRQDLIEDLERLEAKENKTGFLLLAGLDRMSLVSEIYGSSFADDLLEKVKDMFAILLKGQAKFHHISGDIFALLFEDRDVGEMNDIAQNILKIFYNQPFLVHDRPIHQIVSLGGVSLGDPDTSPASMVSRAELALQDAKNRGRGCFIEYSEDLGREVRDFKETLIVGDAFLRGFKDGRVKIAFQGVVSSRTKGVSFHECLIRLIDEDGKVRSAGEFIEAVEKMGLTRLVDTFASREAIKELKDHPNISLSVNVSNHTFTDSEWLKLMTMELRDHPDVAKRLIVEITESVVMSNIGQTTRVIHSLQDLGCRIALDDFGAGQTAFSQLKDLSLDIVKIDKSFIREMDKEENKLFIRTLHSLASAMNLETVGEGAETLGEADMLAKDGIDHIQGYVYGLPTLDRPWMNHGKQE